MNNNTAPSSHALVWTGRLFRLTLFCCGAMLAGLSIGACAVSGFGADPITVFYEGLSATFGITQGTASNLTAISMVVITLFINRRELGVGTLLAPFILGSGIDVFLSLPLSDLMFTSRIIMLVAGLAGIALGIAMQIVASFGRGSYDALIISLCTKLGKDYVVIRWALDALLLITGMLMGGRLTLATVVAILLLGKIITFFVQLLKRIFGTLLTASSRQQVTTQ